MIKIVASARELKINNDLAKAITAVLGHEPNAAEPTIVLAAYVHSLRDSYGLSEHFDLDDGHFTHLLPPTSAAALLAEYLGISDERFERETVGDRLYVAFTQLADDPAVLRLLNKNEPLWPEGLLKVAQVGWNLEHHDARRPRLPIASGQAITQGRSSIRAHIKVPGENKDFASMKWTARTNKGVTGLGVGQAAASSSQGFRTKVALLSVLVARCLVEANPHPTRDFSPAELISTGAQRAIVWPRDDAGLEPPEAHFADGIKSAVRPSTPTTPHVAGRILVGGFNEVGDQYQPRTFDTVIREHWKDGGDRRLWLCGGPGLGKSFTARKVMQDALRAQPPDRDELLIWVDSANAETVTRELARAADLIPALRVPQNETDAGRDSIRARQLLRHLATTDSRWLVVFDNADAEDLIAHDLVPTGVNSNGRLLVTTTSRSTRIVSSGRQISADLFSSTEAQAFVAQRLPHATVGQSRALANATGHHPLALSIAVSTIAANSMEVEDWLREFRDKHLDEAADHPDSGGYPRLISSTWRVALEKASRGIPEDVIERAVLVAAVQNPDGHPTWLWQCAEIHRWVHGSSDLDVPSGKIPPAVKRLVDHSVLTLTGNSWRHGKISIHQLAARSVRENADPSLLREIAAILTRQWLLQLTDNPTLARPEDLTAALEPIHKLACIDTDTRNATITLLSYARPSVNVLSLVEFRDVFRVISPHLMNGGLTGKAEAARQIKRIGSLENDLGLKTEAQESFCAAADIYESLIRDVAIDDELLAECLRDLSELNEQYLNAPKKASEQLEQALRVLKRTNSSGSASEQDVRNALSLFDVHQMLNNEASSRAALDQAITATQALIDTSPDSALERKEEVGKRLIEVGRLDEAFTVLSDAIRLAESTTLRNYEWTKRSIRRELARIHFLRKEWALAERLLARNDGELVLLASVQLHQMRAGDLSAESRVTATLHKAARQIQDEPDTSPEEKLAEAKATLEELRSDPAHSLEVIADLRLRVLALRAWEQRKWDDAADLASGCIRLMQGLAATDPGEHQRNLALAYTFAAIASLRAGRSNATQLATNSVSIFETLTALDPSDAQAKSGLFDALIALGSAGNEFGAIDVAEQAAQRAEKLAQDTDIARSSTRLDQALFILATCAERSGDLQAAITHAQRRVEVCRTAASVDSPSREEQKKLSDSLGALSRLHSLAGQWVAAAPPAIECSQILQELQDKHPADRDLRRQLADALGFALAVQWAGVRNEEVGDDQPTNLLAGALRTVAVLEKILFDDPTDYATQARLGETLFILAAELDKTGEGSASVDALMRSANHLQLPAELDPSSHKVTQLSVLRALEVGLREIGRTVEAEEIASRADRLNAQFPEEGPALEEGN